MTHMPYRMWRYSTARIKLARPMAGKVERDGIGGSAFRGVYQIARL
jgi:hypothetical protein